MKTSEILGCRYVKLVNPEAGFPLSEVAQLLDVILIAVSCAVVQNARILLEKPD